MILRRLAEAIRKQDWFTILVEFVIVVLGIFVGLQVDNWNQMRRDRALENEYLARLADDMRWNIEFFRTFETRYSCKAETILLLKSDGARERVSNEPEEIFRRVHQCNWTAFPPVRDSTFSELMSSGRISLIRDTGLRGELSVFYSRHKTVQQIFSVPWGDYRRLVAETTDGEANFHWYRTGEPGAPDVLRKSLETLIGHPGFDAAANAEIAYSSGILVLLEEYRGMAQEMLTRLSGTG